MQARICIASPILISTKQGCHSIDCLVSGANDGQCILQTHSIHSDMLASAFVFVRSDRSPSPPSSPHSSISRQQLSPWGRIARNSDTNDNEDDEDENDSGNDSNDGENSHMDKPKTETLNADNSTEKLNTDNSNRRSAVSYVPSAAWLGVQLLVIYVLVVMAVSFLHLAPTPAVPIPIHRPLMELQMSMGEFRLPKELEKTIDGFSMHALSVCSCPDSWAMSRRG